MMVPNIELALKYICVNCWQVLVKISKFSIFVGIEWILLVHNGLKEFLKYVTLGIFFTKLFWPTVRKKNSSDWEKLLKFEAEGQEFAKFVISLEQFIRRVKRQIRNLMFFLTYSWRFLRSNKLEQFSRIEIVKYM